MSSKYVSVFPYVLQFAYFLLLPEFLRSNKRLDKDVEEKWYLFLKVHINHTKNLSFS